MPKKTAPVLSPKLFQFFVELAQNNERAWFVENKPRYERDVKEPLLAFITEVGRRLGKISKHLVADARPVGGSLFRLNRDVRFSKDKSPYKTHAGVHFRHAAGKDVHAPGIYVHFEPRQVFVATGMWHPEPAALAKIRGAIAADPKAWKKAAGGCALEGEVLTRVPKGFDKDHPAAEDLKRKDFITHVPLNEKIACSPKLADEVIEAARGSKGLMKFLAQALELPF